MNLLSLASLLVLGSMAAAEPASSPRVPREPDWEGSASPAAKAAPQDKLPHTTPGGSDTASSDTAPSDTGSSDTGSAASPPPAADATVSVTEAQGVPSGTTTTLSPFDSPSTEDPAPSTPAADTAPSENPAPRAHRSGRAPVEPLPPARFNIDVGPRLVLIPMHHTSGRAFSSNRSLFGGGVFVRGTARVARSGLFVGGGISYQRLSSSRDILGTTGRVAPARSNLTIDDVLFHVRAAYEVVEGLQPFVDLAAGPSIVEAGFHQGRNVSARSVEGTVAAHGGLTFTMPRRWLSHARRSRVTFGIETAVGYQHRGATTLRGRPDAPPNAIPFADITFGDIRASGFSWQTHFVVRFL